jgi:dihydrofolate reductase
VISLVVAYSANRVIGRDGVLPWRLPSDMRRFRELTTGHTVLMGRRTFESLPDAFRPLPDRRNLVLSSDPAFKAGGAEVFSQLGAALAACADECFVIGGGITYLETLPLAERIYATEIEVDLEGDVRFPELGEGWRCVQSDERIVENELGLSFRVYERTPTTAV